MAQSLEEIKASFTPPTHDNINGVQVELSAEEAQAFVDTCYKNQKHIYPCYATNALTRAFIDRQEEELDVMFKVRF